MRCKWVGHRTEREWNAKGQKLHRSSLLEQITLRSNGKTQNMSPPILPKLPQLGIAIQDNVVYDPESTSLITALTSPPASIQTSPLHGPVQPLHRSRKRAGTLTKIACYECRKRKCKCDGEKPVCGPCRGRGARCDFDHVAGSVHSEEMKTRIRRLEDDKRQLQGQNDSFREENMSLQAKITQLSTELNRRDFTQQWDEFERSAQGVQLQQSANGYKLSHSPASSFNAGDGVLDNVMPDTLQNGHGAVDATNAQLARFLNTSRHARQELIKARVSPACLDMSTLDVSSIFDASRLPDELSWWASVLPRSHPGTPLISRLAEAYITYQQLYYIITGEHKVLERLPQFLRYVLPTAELCVPHAVTVSSDTLSFVHLPIAALLSVMDAPQDAPNSISSLFLSSAIAGGGWSGMGSNPCFPGNDGKVHLTPGFELYVSQQSSWMPKTQLGTTGLDDVVNGAVAVSAGG